MIWLIFLMGVNIGHSLLYHLQLLRLGVNLKNFPSSAAPATYAILFHLGIAAVLLLYVLFWLKVFLLIFYHVSVNFFCRDIYFSI